MILDSRAIAFSNALFIARIDKKHWRQLGLACFVLYGLFLNNKSVNATSWHVVERFPVSAYNISVFATSVAYHDGAIYTVNVEEPEGETSRWKYTVIRKGEPDDGGGWNWKKRVIDRQTMADMYHTQPSVAVDMEGYVHVAYNMHNSPWQYQRSVEPKSILGFEFLGDSVTTEELRRIVEQNKTHFPSDGVGAIPHTQITYPAFFYDRNGGLYISYRFAAAPRRAWPLRRLSAGIAKYDELTRSWVSVGGPVEREALDVEVPKGEDVKPAIAFASQMGWTPYLPRIGFDRQNGMHVVWTWRGGGPGREVDAVSYAFSPDSGRSFFDVKGRELTLPLRVQDGQIFREHASGGGLFAPTAVTVDVEGWPEIVVQPVSGGRRLLRYSQKDGSWSAAPMPSAAPHIATDDRGTQWAIATGPKLFRRKAGVKSWELIIDGIGLCHPKPEFSFDTGIVVVHATDCNRPEVNIVIGRLPAA